MIFIIGYRLLGDFKISVRGEQNQIVRNALLRLVYFQFHQRKGYSQRPVGLKKNK